MTVAPWPSVDHSTCEHCGAHVTDRFRRVFGDDRNRAHRCGECDSYARLSRGSAAGVDVPVPDPERVSTRAVTFEVDTEVTANRE